MKLGVGPIIEDDKAGIDGVGFFAIINVNGGSVSAHVIIGLEQRDVVFAMQVPGRGEARDAAADNGDPGHA